MVGSLNRTPARMFMTKQVLSVLRPLQSLFEAEYVLSVGGFLLCCCFGFCLAGLRLSFSPG